MSDELLIWSVYVAIECVMACLCVQGRAGLFSVNIRKIMSDKKIKYAFRIVHIDNIPYILKNGIVNAAKSTKKDDSYISIGDESLIEVRRNQNIIHTESCIGDYIPFYFGPRSPMLYTIQNGYNGVKKM